MTRFPVLVEEVTADWLAGALGGSVESFSIEPVGTGQIGTCYRIGITGSEVVNRVVLKLPHPDPAVRRLVAGAYRSEARFYRDLARTVSIRVPTCYHVEFEEDGDFVLLLADLAPAEQGDQITGCEMPQALDAVVNLAGLHGPRWCDPSLVENTGFGRVAPDEVTGLVAVYAPATESFLESLGAGLSSADVAVLRAVPDLVRDWIEARPERFALIHGDYRLDNIMFPPDGAAGSVAVDWQTLSIGLPARDLAYLVATSLDPQPRRDGERELVAAYHSALPEAVRAGYPLELCWDDYAFAMLQAPLTAVLGQVYGTPTERGDRMFTVMASRACAAIRDLDTLARVGAEV